MDVPAQKRQRKTVSGPEKGNRRLENVRRQHTQAVRSSHIFADTCDVREGERRALVVTQDYLAKAEQLRAGVFHLPQ